MVCNLMLPHGLTLNKFRIWNRWHIQERNHANGWTKNSPYYSATAGARTRDLPLPLAMNRDSDSDSDLFSIIQGYKNIYIAIIKQYNI
jgi:hypothetical protein